MLSANQVDRAKAAILKRVEARIGKPVDPDRVTEEDFQSPMGTSLDHVGYLLYDDPVFEEILVAEKPLALVSYLVGESCRVASISCFFKGPGPTGVLPLHAATLGPQPFPPYTQTANVNYALTPYSREGGATAIVPGSHRRARQPSFSEMALGGDQANPEAVPLDMAPGDCAVWHGHTWHGSYGTAGPGHPDEPGPLLRAASCRGTGTPPRRSAAGSAGASRERCAIPASPGSRSPLRVDR